MMEKLLGDAFLAVASNREFSNYSEHRMMQAYVGSYKRVDMEREEKSKIPDERDPELKSDLEAQPDELGSDPSQVGFRSAGQSVGAEGLSSEAEATEESVEELADTDQALESAAIEGVEDAADHPERPIHTHEEYGNPEDVPPQKRDEAA